MPEDILVHDGKLNYGSKVSFTDIFSTHEPHGNKDTAAMLQKYYLLTLVPSSANRTATQWTM